MIVGLVKIGENLYVRMVKFRTEPYHPDPRVNGISNWSTLKRFNEKDLHVFGTLEVFG